MLNITLDNGQAWSVEFYTRGNVFTHERKVYEHKANLTFSHDFLSVSKDFQVLKTNRLSLRSLVFYSLVYRVLDHGNYIQSDCGFLLIMFQI